MKTDGQKIALFMGEDITFNHCKGVGLMSYEDYYTEWNNLMPVIEKIEIFNGAVHIDSNDVFLHFPNNECRCFRKQTTKIDAAYKAVIEFIDWYNKHLSNPKEMKNFYCQQKCGEVDFSIEEWNKNYNEVMAMPISEAEKRKLIDGEPCKEQCFDCIAIVGETRLKNKR